ncbi:MAG: OmpA family protein [Azovibrio sp.]|uniref:OmpA family protein n=1 Tax=Azovibrio sp. TaxID=1872673 RepID=UPI003C752CB5
MKPNKSLWAVLACLGLSACVSERVVLLPEPDGKPSALVIRSGGQQQVLDQPYEAVQRQGGSLTATTMPAAAVQERFGAVLAQMPPRPVSFVLYFLEGSSELTPESRAQFQAVRQELASRPVAEMLIVGHTDTVGDLRGNDVLSLERASAMREALKAEGIDPGAVEVAGRGERELLVKTGDEVAEPRNRRVVIRIR